MFNDPFPITVEDVLTYILFNCDNVKLRFTRISKTCTVPTISY
jgi:LEA14-like dessication related protein